MIRIRGSLAAFLLLSACVGAEGQSAITADAAVVSASTPIAYDSSVNGPVEVVALDGSNARQVGPAGATLPGWKSDGSALAMDTGSGGVVVSLGGTTKQLPALGTNPTYSPDGSQLLYWTTRAPNKELVGMANADGTNAHVVWDDTLGILSADLEFRPQWAPDGSAVVFNTFPAGCTWCLETGSPAQVWMVNADGTGLHHVDNADGIEHVRWSPDGLWLVGDGLARVHPDGTDRSQLGSGEGGAPTWSPDGTHIAYVGGTGSGTAVSIADADGTNARAVVIDPNLASSNYSDVQWLPDGSGLVFEVQAHNAATNTDTSLIETINADGGGLRTVASGQDPIVPTYVTRLAGATRVDTAVSVSRATFPTSSAIVVTRDDLFPDALAAGPLAAKLHGPLLLSSPTGVTTALGTEVKRLGAQTAYLIGDTTALSANVETGLRAAGITSIVRIGGATRYDTARLIADRVGGSAVYIARGDDFADAASVAGLAAYQQRPILLTQPNALAPATLAAMADLHARTATIVGGTSAVTSSVQASLAGATVTVTRVSGGTRYGTSAAVANMALAAGMTGAPWLADGANWPDALSAGPAAAEVKGNLLLVDPHALIASPDTRAWLIAHPQATVVTLGGPDVVSPSDSAGALTGS